ncbi:MAG: bifunctional diaminohydroxyphosphoribosylaminopyrimidine deaminase/5-amino-6-(5-phosphoribosylamino)uracil reductase RibD [Phycisphaerales bacterium]|nr:bifunctional diaminohydroxyphosphoribosylaminopyrimidine deaminase/5-amino-6-(5-phosphoribosylamino)uracil reductase RibD [Phycisphaerales bacterium]
MNSSLEDKLAKQYLDIAARVAARGFGNVEPNPMVGAVLVKNNSIIGFGHHTQYGHLHAEREAIANASQLGNDPEGSTLYCTLEPCSHHGKQPPCTDAVIEAKVSKVVIARKDPAKISSGGLLLLERAGISVIETSVSSKATHLSDAFIHRIQTGRPWVIAKWAQTLDGRIATRTGESQWISNSKCRNRVHRIRAKVDAIVIGVGTANADDPMLNARDCRSVRKIAKRVVLDTNGSLNQQSKLVLTAKDIPTIICTTQPDKFKNTDATVLPCSKTDSGIDIKQALETLSSDYDVSTILVEAGPRVLGTLIEDDLINEAVVHLASGIIGDNKAFPVATGRNVPNLDGMRRFNLVRMKKLDDDIELFYRNNQA